MKKHESVLLQIAELGQSVIGSKAKEAENIQSAKIQNLIDDMIATCKEVNGVGIAAPQVFQGLRLFIVASHPNERYPKAPKMKPLAVLNPKIVSFDGKVVKDWEGCLSVPGIRGLVPRNTVIQVEYMTREGKKVKKTFKDFVARIFQHEYDHIKGKVFLERVVDPREFVSEKEFRRIVKARVKKRK